MPLWADSVVTLLVKGLKFLACCLLPDKNISVIAFSDANMYATSMTERNVFKATVPDRMV